MTYVNDLSRNHHFVLVQEHWQYDEQICRFEKEIPNVNVHGVSEMDPTTRLVGRPFGGCCILWQKDLVGTVTPIPCDHKRMCCVLHDTGKVRLLLIICVYMQARSQDFCVGGRFEQKVDLFVLFFLSVKGGGCGGMLTRLCFKPLCC